MELNIRAEGINLTEDLENFVKKKIRKIERRMPELPLLDVLIAMEETRSGTFYRVKMTAEIGGLKLMGEEEGRELWGVIEAASKNIARQIEKFKGKRREGIS